MTILFIGIITELTLAECRKDNLIGTFVTLEDAAEEVIIRTFMECLFIGNVIVTFSYAEKTESSGSDEDIAIGALG